MNKSEKIVRKMVSIFRKMDTDQYINMHFLCKMAVESLKLEYDWREYESCWSFYNEFHKERIKQKIRIKRMKHRQGEAVGTPPNCDWFARCGEKTSSQKAFELALKRYKKKFKELPHLDDDVCDAVLKPRKQLTRILNNAVDKGAKVRNSSLYRSAWVNR